MPLILTSPPAVEPVSLAEAKLHLRVDTADDDGPIATLIAAARKYAEASAGVALIAQGWSYFLDRWPGPVVALPVNRLIAVDAVRVFGEDDEPAIVDEAHYVVDGASRPARLMLRRDRAWPSPGRVANGIEIALTAGFGAAPTDVPEPLRAGILRLVAHWYENRGDASAPLSVEALLQPYREFRL